jgi:LysR family transcriptional regulator, transcriptional activator for dmlA
MSLLDDTALFAAIVSQGGFSHAAKYLGLSNGLISRRIANLEKKLGVSLIKRTTRKIQLTPEGELFWRHAERIQQELNSALSLIQASEKRPRGTIRVSAPLYFGRHYLTPIIAKFMADFTEINIDLILSNQKLDPIKSQLDLVIRGAGYLGKEGLKDSSMQMKMLLKEKICLYASPAYLIKYGEPTHCADLHQHTIINYAENNHHSENITWTFLEKKVKNSVVLNAKFNVNDIESAIIACTENMGIGKFTTLNVKNSLFEQALKPILVSYDWGHYYLYAVYPQQKALPKRMRLFLDFIAAHIPRLIE